jgi:hypothetical protein
MESIELTDAQNSCLKAFREQHVLWGQCSKVYEDLATAQHYRLTSATMALYLFIIHPELYKKATSALRAAGKKYPNPLISTHGRTATNLKFITILRQQVRQPKSGFCVVPKPLRGASCHDPPSKFFIPPSSYAGPSTAPAAPAYPAPVAPEPLTQSHHAAYQSPPKSSMPPLYHQTTFDSIEPLDHVMEDAEPGAASPRDMDMQGPYVLDTPSSGESDGLPFHPKYVGTPGLEVMSHAELAAWRRNNPHAPAMYGSQPTSAGHTRPVSPSSSDSASLRRQTSAEGHYTPVTRQVTPEDIPDVAPAHSPPTTSSGRSSRTALRGLQPLTPLITQMPITGQDTARPPHSRQSSGGYSYQPSPVVESSEIPEGLLPINDS